jgi:hypothetical protein
MPKTEPITSIKDPRVVEARELTSAMGRGRKRAALPLGSCRNHGAQAKGLPGGSDESSRQRHSTPAPRSPPASSRMEVAEYQICKSINARRIPANAVFISSASRP